MTNNGQCQTYLHLMDLDMLGSRALSTEIGPTISCSVAMARNDVAAEVNDMTVIGNVMTGSFNNNNIAMTTRNHVQLKRR